MYLFLKIGIVFSFLCLGADQSSGYREVIIKENLVSPETRKLPLPLKSWVIVIGQDQCSHCNSSVLNLITTCRKQDRHVVVLRILNSSLMDCKKDEFFFKDEFPDLDFEYIDQGRVEIFGEDSLVAQISVGTTPVFISLGEGIKTYTADELVDEYGRLRKLKIR